MSSASCLEISSDIVVAMITSALSAFAAFLRDLFTKATGILSREQAEWPNGDQCVTHVHKTKDMHTGLTDADDQSLLAVIPSGRW
jgi:hypothetical protein